MPPIIGDPDELITAIRHTAQGDARSIRAEAEKQAEQIRKDAEQKAKTTREEILSDARDRAREIERRHRVKATREEKSEYLRARESLLEDIWQAAEDRLRELPGDEDTYINILRRLALGAVSEIRQEEAVLAADEKGHRILTNERLAEWSKEAGEATGTAVSFKRAEEPADTWGGLIVIDAKGRRRIDQTFAARLNSAREEIRNRVFNELVTS